jgi:hypothetical protein
MSLGKTNPFPAPMKNIGPNRAAGCIKPATNAVAIAAQLVRAMVAPATISRFGPRGQQTGPT